jgi:hypothetical protein
MDVDFGVYAVSFKESFRKRRYLLGFFACDRKARGSLSFKNNVWAVYGCA